MTFPTLATQPTATVKKPAKVPVDQRICKVELTWQDEQYDELVRRLRVIGDALGFAHDHSATVEFLINTFYEDHRAEYEQEEATA